MSHRARYVAVALLLSALVFVLPGASTSATSRSGLGSQLVNQFYTELQQHNVARLRQFVSPAFQATYEIAASEVINGRQLRTGYAPRISVFVNGAKGWQIVGHANFNMTK